MISVKAELNIQPVRELATNRCGYCVQYGSYNIARVTYVKITVKMTIFFYKTINKKFEDYPISVHKPKVSTKRVVIELAIVIS